MSPKKDFKGFYVGVVNFQPLLFKAKTEQELKHLITIGGTIMAQAVEAYHHVSASGEFKELERLRDRARRDEASALAYARREGARKADEKWEGVVAEKDKTYAAVLAKKDAILAERNAALAERDRAVAAAEAELKALRAQLGL